ncbi:hypothetical protein ADK75_06455 [Streptomyces virginiae]|uniref:Uncharacterized protein n=1 Tax=Streptomyces virginiae TaxID=1961 RepID=A0A0L8N238_STRVG|nr:hypothetical protein ADK75_06455 [Streptomyces virginiae]
MIQLPRQFPPYDVADAAGTPLGVLLRAQGADENVLKRAPTKGQHPKIRMPFDHVSDVAYSSPLPTSNLICLTFPLQLSSAYT